MRQHAARQARADAVDADDHIQSGFNGQNEYDLRELWLTRVGKRSDVFLGRQFVPDLGGVKFDGLRIDYAKSREAHAASASAACIPLRGSRSIDTRLRAAQGPTARPGGPASSRPAASAPRIARSTRTARSAASRWCRSQKEQPRFYVTSNGYLRSGSKLDLYHFASSIDLGTAAQEPAHIG